MIGNKNTAFLKNVDRYQTIIDLVPGVIFELTPDGKLTTLSPSFERITGWKRNKWLGKNFKGLIHPDDREYAIRKFGEGSLGKSSLLQFELRILTKSGKYITGEFVSKAETVKGKVVGKVGVVRDVTESRSFQKRMVAQYLISQILAKADSVDNAVVRSMEILGETFDWDLGFFGCLITKEK